jgi:hypothetical protein
MAWESFSVDQYTAYLVTQNTTGFPNIYGFVNLHWGGKPRATLWFHRDSEPTIPANGSFNSGGYTNYYARFRQAQFSDCVDLLRNEKPIFFQWNEATKGAFLATSPEPVGEAERP